MHSNFMSSDSEKDKQLDHSAKETSAERKDRRRGRRGKRATAEVSPVTIEGASIDDAVQKVLNHDDDAATIIHQHGAASEEGKSPESDVDYVLEAGPAISIDDLPPELRDEVKFEQQFYELEHGTDQTIDSDDGVLDDPTPVSTIVTPSLLNNNTSTVPAPAIVSTIPILPDHLSADHDVDLGGLDEDEPKAGVFQLPKDFAPAPEIVAATKAAASAQIGIVPPASLKQTPIDPALHDRETLAPPPKDELSLLGDIVVTYGEEEKDEITQDLSAQSALLWAFRESRFCAQYESDMAYFQVHCLKDPQLERPNIEDYLERFQKEQEKKGAK